MHITIPITVGIKNEAAVHFQLLVSFLIVRSVVVHGKCKSEKSITFIAVTIVQPFADKMSNKLWRLDISTKLHAPV